jgi:hypothetical protein
MRLIWRIAGRDLIAIEKPFTRAISVTVNTYQAAILRHTEHLDHRPRPAHEIVTQRLAALPNMDPISNVDCSRR